MLLSYLIIRDSSRSSDFKIEVFERGQKVLKFNFMILPFGIVLQTHVQFIKVLDKCDSHSNLNAITIIELIIPHYLLECKFIIGKILI